MRDTADLPHLAEAKLIFEVVLTPHVREFEKRSSKSWLNQKWERIITGYGAEGYKRTLDFLAEMRQKKIKTTENLINLTRSSKYTQGSNLPLLLQKAVSSICGFTPEHTRATPNAIPNIYKKIMESKDYGYSYLMELRQSKPALFPPR